jgi:uncharacterized membrane protein HdeD (DUF308 family)
MSSIAGAFLGGLIAMSFGVIGLFFVKFWIRTRDSLFIAFAIAFWLLAISQTLVALRVVPREEQSWIYVLRLAAFVLIAIAIVRKNAVRDVRRGGLTPD